MAQDKELTTAADTNFYDTPLVTFSQDDMSLHLSKIIQYSFTDNIIPVQSSNGSTFPRVLKFKMLVVLAYIYTELKNVI
jgi:hypothetical protein